MYSLKTEASLWEQTVQRPPTRPFLQGNIKAQAVVVGGGLAGILCAYELTKSGINTVLLEASRIGEGQIKGTSAKITAQHGLLYDRIEKNYGTRAAQQYAKAQMESIARYRELVEKEEINCDFTETFSCLYTERYQDILKKEAEAAKRAGLGIELTQKTELPFPVSLALRLPDQAQFHPLKFLFSLSEKLCIYENSRVISVGENIVYTAKGSVSAKAIIFCTHYPIVNIRKLLFVRMHQSRTCYLSLEGTSVFQDMYYGIDQNALTVRSYGKSTLVGGSSYRTGQNTEGGKNEALLKKALSAFPEAKPVVFWSSQDCMTCDGLPYIGRYIKTKPWYIATGFGKWGMTNAMTAAQIIVGELTGRRKDYAPVFSPDRFRLTAASHHLGQDIRISVKSLAKPCLPNSDNQKILQSLLPNQMKIIRVNGSKRAVVRDNEGKLHMVKPRCSHLGCALTWNPDEQTWDCPCHGSRFTKEGDTLCTPAVKSIRP